MALSEAQLCRQRMAALKRHRPGSPELIEARRELAATNLATYIKQVVDAAPPLTAAQRDRLALLLQSGGPDAA